MLFLAQEARATTLPAKQGIPPARKDFKGVLKVGVNLLIRTAAIDIRIY